MAVSLKHKFASAKTDGGDATLVRPSNWNDEHDLLIDASKIVGRTTAGTGSAEEIAVSADLTLTAGTLGVAASLSGKTLVEPAIDGTIVEEVFTITDGASVDIDPSDGSIQLWTLTASRTPVAPTSWTAGQGITLQIADGTAYAITWTTMGVVWAGGTAPTLATSGYTVVELWKVGTTIYGALVGDVA
jgi:hypothetical protein